MKQDDTINKASHLSIAELIAYLDDEQPANGDTSQQAHIQKCSYCQEELENIAGIGRAVFEHIDSQPSSEVWSRLQHSLYGSQGETSPAQKLVTGCYEQELGSSPSNNVHRLKPSTTQSLSRAIYALAASVAFVGVVAVFMFSQQQTSNEQTQLMQASINELMINSRGLEQSLQAVRMQNLSLSEANQRVADRLYWKLSYVDQLIHEVAPTDSQQVKTLWNDRVDALNELKNIYFERDAARQTSEI